LFGVRVGVRRALDAIVLTRFPFFLLLWEPGWGASVSKGMDELGLGKNPEEKMSLKWLSILLDF